MKVCLCCWGITEKTQKKRNVYCIDDILPKKKRRNFQKKNKMYFSLYDSIS